MNIVVSETIRRLNIIKENLNDQADTNLYNSGINLANQCLREAITSRIDEIVDLYGDEKATSDVTNSDYAISCIEYTDSLKKVFKELYDEQDNTAFGRGYKSQVRKFFVTFKPIQEWLQKVSIENIYQS